MPDLLVGQLCSFISPVRASHEVIVVGNKLTVSGGSVNLMSGKTSLSLNLGAQYRPEPMSMLYSIVPADSALLHGFRPFFGSAVALSIVPGSVAIRRGDVAKHQEWMRRAYAIGMGAGTQALTSAARHFIAENRNRDGWRLVEHREVPLVR